MSGCCYIYTLFNKWQVFCNKKRKQETSYFISGGTEWSVSEYPCSRRSAMFFLLGGNDKKARKPQPKTDGVVERVKELFLTGKFPVVTTDNIEGKEISKVLGLVCCRGYDSEEAFFGMASRAVTKGAHAIVGYIENVAFHPDGSKYFSCYGTAVMFEWEPEEKYGAALLMSRNRTGLSLVGDAETGDAVSLNGVPRVSGSGANSLSENRNGSLGFRTSESFEKEEKEPTLRLRRS